jgi:hypothetical protein
MESAGYKLILEAPLATYQESLYREYAGAMFLVMLLNRRHHSVECIPERQSGHIHQYSA